MTLQRLNADDVKRLLNFAKSTLSGSTLSSRTLGSIQSRAKLWMRIDNLFDKIFSTNVKAFLGD